MRESKAVELRFSAYNAFNNTCRSALDTSVSFRARGPYWSDGFDLYNTGTQPVGRQPADRTPQQLYDVFRTGVGFANLPSVDPNRTIEIGMRFRF